MSFDAPADDPAQVLSELARRRGLRYSRAHVREALERHPEPSSLLALVEVAPSLGLKATAGQAELEVLEELEPEELPTILHFTGPEGGFGLLEAVLPEGRGFRLWDSRHGRRVVGREALAQAWRGIVVFLEREGHGLPEQGYWAHRVREVLREEWHLRTGLAGPDASPATRWGLGVLVTVLLGLGISSQPPEWRWGAATLAGLTALGMVASLMALAGTRGRASFLCGTGGPLDCESVLGSGWAYVAGIPLSALGAAFFGASLLVQCTLAWRVGAAPLWLAGTSFLPAVLLSVLLVGVQVRMRRLCTLCMTVHALNGAGAALCLLWVWPRISFPPPGLVPAALWLALLFALLLSSVVPALAHATEDAEARQERARLLRSPLGTLAKLSLEPLLDVTAEAVGVQVGEAEAPHRLVVLVHPSCKLCGPTLEELESLMERHGAWLCGFVGVAPMDPNDPRDVATCEALATVGAAFGGAAFLQAYGEARRDFARLYGEAAPRDRLAEVLGLDPASLEKAREQAGAWVRAATVLKTRHAQGIPAFFLDGRWCEAPLSHVEAWCEWPALLELLSPRGDAP